VLQKNGKKSFSLGRNKKQLLEQPKITICLRAAHAHGEGIQKSMIRRIKQSNMELL
jgi:hypothetical protein